MSPRSNSHPFSSRSRIADLVFPQAGQPQGFATLATTQWDGNPEPVVRELLQNALDAAANANRDQCEVHITIRDVSPDDLPGIDSYRRHFERAVEERRGKPQGAAEKTIISRIESVLHRDRIRVLMCRDNGIGLSEDRMGRLLTEGNTDKEDVGAGAFGVGHLTAFAASNTRYVLYAGRSCNGNEGVRDVSSAHAILASRTKQDGNVVRGLGAHGYWLLRPQAAPDTSGEQLGLFDPRYPDFAPPLLDAELSRLSDTGSVICITGFNAFRSEQESPLDAIARVSAKNFLVAIQRQEMTVRIRDETANSSPSYIVDGHGLDALLFKQRSQKRTRSGWLPGEQAYRCLRTLEAGQKFTLSCGARARMRILDSREGTSSHVQVFRNGMWITNRADELTPPNFTGFNPFDAVIMISDGEIGALVREAEGPEHRGLDRRRLRDGKSKRRLLHILREIKGELQSRVGTIERTTDFTPDNFAIFRGSRSQKAEAVGPYRPRTDLASKDDDSGGTTPGKSDDANSKVIDPTSGRGKRRGGGAKPKPGKTVPGRTSVVAARGRAGRLDTLRVHWKPDSHGRRWRGGIGVRVRIPSGSDSTCEMPLGPQWLQVKELRLASPESAIQPVNTGFEVPLRWGEAAFTIILKEPIQETDAKSIEIDVVRRKEPTAEGATGGGKNP